MELSDAFLGTFRGCLLILSSLSSLPPSISGILGVGRDPGPPHVHASLPCTRIEFLFRSFRVFHLLSLCFLRTPHDNVAAITIPQW